MKLIFLNTEHKKYYKKNSVNILKQEKNKKDFWMKLQNESTKTI